VLGGEHGRHDGIPFSLLGVPENPGKQDRADAHGNIRNVECRPAGGAHPDVDEVDDAVIRPNTIDEIAAIRRRRVC